MGLKWLKPGVLASVLCISFAPTALAQTPAPVGALPECSSGVNQGPIRLKVNYFKSDNLAYATFLSQAVIESMHLLKPTRELTSVFKLYFGLSPDGTVTFDKSNKYFSTFYAGHLVSDPEGEFIVTWKVTAELNGQTFEDESINLDTPVLTTPYKTEAVLYHVPFENILAGINAGQTMTVKVWDPRKPERYYNMKIDLGALAPALEGAKYLTPRLVATEQSGKCKSG